MKYGDKLRQRSIYAWRHQNIDYDDVKHFIKERTSAPQRKDSAITNEEWLQQTEDDLFHILEDQHSRIDLFVKSKSREIQLRTNASKKQLRKLAARSQSGEGLSAAQLEQYSRLESDVLKAGNDIKSLARFIGAQRTGFGKLLKKYKKWSGSSQLEDRFREKVLSDSKSFTKFDLGPWLDDYSETLHNIRALYTSRLRHAADHGDESEPSSYLIGSAIVSQLQSSIATKRKAEFDTAIATVPLGDDGVHATYFVHSENIVELQVLLLQHLNYYLARSRQNSVVGPLASLDGDVTAEPSHDCADYFWLGIDNPYRFAEEHNTLQIAEHEARVGSTPQRSRISARWNTDEVETNALVATRVGETHVQVNMLKSKNVRPFFDKTAEFPPRGSLETTLQQANELSATRAAYTRDDDAKPLFLMTSHRSRFVGLSNTSQHLMLSTLDTGIALQRYDSEDKSGSFKFPFAVLIVRYEGKASTNLVEVLDQSHLVERAQGFSMEHQAIWQLCESANISTPACSALLTQDIRKLPPPALKHSDTATTTRTLTSQQDGSASNGTSSVRGAMTDSTTAVETIGGSSILADDLEQPPLSSFRNKRRRAFPEGPVNPQGRYWSEYDHPEDGDDADGSYVIYIDPDEKTTFDRMIDTIAGWFKRSKNSDEESLLHGPDTPRDEEESSDDETASPKTKTRRHTGYGTIQRHSQVADSFFVQAEQAPFLPQGSVACLAAAAVILIVGYILSVTGRHRFGRTVNAGVLFAFITSVLFIIAGVVLMARTKLVRQSGIAVAVAVVLLEAVAAGGLLAHMIG